MFGFLRNFQAIFWSDYMILISTNNEWESSCCSVSSPTFGGVSVLDFSHSNRCFNLHFSADMWFGTSFHMLIYFMCIIFFNEISMKVPGSFFNWVFFFLLSLRVLCKWWIILSWLWKISWVNICSGTNEKVHENTSVNELIWQEWTFLIWIKHILIKNFKSVKCSDI